MKKKIAAASMLSFAIVLSVSATPTSNYRPLPANEFRQVQVEEYDIIIEPHIPLSVPTDRPQVAPKAKAKVIDKSKPKTATSSHVVKGVASWYCLPGRSRCTYTHSGGMYAAIRKDLLHLRGKRINVCAGKDCIVVTVIDCNCGSNANLIDLYSDAFRKLAPLSQGTVKVTISW